MNTLVIIPTYNERENIRPFISAVLGEQPQVSILVIDDGSPDGTADRVREMQKDNTKIYLIENKGKGGLGKAYLQGFQWAMANGFDACVQMDADFSHRPQDLGKLLAVLPTGALAIGSRYVQGGNTLNWAWYRKAISIFGSLYSRLILGYPLRDWTGGFNGWPVPVLKKIQLSDVRSEGYSFQIEMKYRALKAGNDVKEVPILFDERREGASKMSLRIVLEAFYRVWQIRFLV